MNLQINIPEQIGKSFNLACKKYSLNENQVIEQLLADYISDLEDFEEASKRLTDKTPNIPLAEIVNKYGLAD
jgi:hypothetical protein